MRVTIIAVGRDRPGPIRCLIDDYRCRCPWPVRLLEIAPRSSGPIERRLADEADRMLKAAGERAVLVALDERGEALDSRAFAARIGQWQDRGAAEIAFLIGGADGLAPVIVERADTSLAFGPMTWPHRLALVMLLEQLYRAGTILAGHPYHRD